MSTGRRLRILVLLFPCILAAAEARGEVIGSPHDLYNHRYLVVDEVKIRTNPQCMDCHFVPPEDRPQIWDRVPTPLEDYDRAGILCASCHDGISMVDRNVDAGLTVFHPKSHGFRLEHAPKDTNVQRAGLPHVNEKRFGCASCHDPHNENNRPFLRVPITNLCQKCHIARIHEGFGLENRTGDHPVYVEPFDNKGGASPISIQPAFALSFPLDYPKRNAVDAPGVHWKSGGHLTYGARGKLECVTCHAFHGVERKGPAIHLLSRDPVREDSDEFCEGCHRGKRGDGEKDPPFPNPGGTVTGRTYHPCDDDRANGLGWNVAIADTRKLLRYVWGAYDRDYKVPRILCTTCHVAHAGMANSPCLAAIDDSAREEGVLTFCEVCHRAAPEGHHGYSSRSGNAITGTRTTIINMAGLGHTYGTVEPGKVYCSVCHRAHNAGYGRKELDYIPILVDRATGLCESCHALGVSHFLGDPTLPSTYGKANPSLKRTPWPRTGKTSYYEGEGLEPKIVTCTSCHSLSAGKKEEVTLPNLLLAPAGEEVEWESGSPDDYLCTGCHGVSPVTDKDKKGVISHPLMNSNSERFPVIYQDHLVAGETPATYTQNGRINCHSCHRAHLAVLPGGVYILKVGRGDNVDPKAIHPRLEYMDLCYSCHPFR